MSCCMLRYANTMNMMCVGYVPQVGKFSIRMHSGATRLFKDFQDVLKLSSRAIKTVTKWHFNYGLNQISMI